MQSLEATRLAILRRTQDYPQRYYSPLLAFPALTEMLIPPGMFGGSESFGDVRFITEARAALSDLGLLGQLSITAFNPAVLRERYSDLDRTLQNFVRHYGTFTSDSHVRVALQEQVDAAPQLLEDVLKAVLKFEQPL